VSKIPTATEPTGSGDTGTNASVIDLTGPLGGGVAANGVLFMLFGTGADTNTGSCRVIGWSKVMTAPGGTFVDDVNVNNGIWIPTVLLEVTLALSVQVGVDNRIINASNRFADTMAIVGTTANAGVDVDVVSPANDTIARAYCDLQGSQKLEFTFSTGSSATDLNALYKLF